MTDGFWPGRRVLVTGGAGFIGSHVVEKLVERGATVSVLDTLESGSRENLASVFDRIRFLRGDCTDPAAALDACAGQGVVMNLAARVGGIEYNRTHQGTMLRDNLLIAAVMMEAARRANVERFLAVSSACVYPRTCSIPTPEREGFLDEPEPTNSGYGWAKRMAEVLARSYAEEFGMRVGIVRPYNAYGPRDHFEPETSHVVPALIKRVLDGENPVTIWGSGRQTRAFLYVEDLAEGMLLAIERYPVPDPVNLGTDEEISIADLIRRILDASGTRAELAFDVTKPDGSPRRQSENQKARKHLGFEAPTRFAEGLARTVEWYRAHIRSRVPA